MSMLEDLTREFPLVDPSLLQEAENVAYRGLYQLSADKLSRLTDADRNAMQMYCAKSFLKIRGIIKDEEAS